MRPTRSIERNGRPELDDAACRRLLETLPHAVLVFDTAGGVMYVNRAGRDAAAASGLVIRGGTLKGATPTLNERLDFGLRSALGGATTIVRCDGGKVPQHWLFHPYSGVSGGTAESGAIALARIPPSARAVELFARAYRLTQAERRVLSHFITPDASVKAVASRAGIGVTTVRSHLKSLFQKTRTRVQRELVSLVLSLPEPPLES